MKPRPEDRARHLLMLQVALNTVDLPGTMRLYSELFGFVSGGGNAFWGPPMAVQGLPPEARGMIWWLVGRERRFQLELFQHTNPPQRRLPQEWRPCDHGWTRIGIAISNFERACAVLQDWHIQTLGPVMRVDGLRRVAFRDPFVGIVVEVLEDGDALPGGRRARDRDLDPAVIYATTSVADLASAREFYAQTLALQLQPLETLHDESAEALWGLGGARREGFIAQAGSRFIEVVQYREPSGQPRRADHRISDQGIMNVGIGMRDTNAIRDLIRTVTDSGLQTTEVFGGDAGLASYVLDAGRELELIGLPEASEPWWGFEPASPFLSGE
jgi:catechol 2,3-dioxygenase-like lactoylglutathione lyase family enzyme